MQREEGNENGNTIHGPLAGLDTAEMISLRKIISRTREVGRGHPAWRVYKFKSLLAEAFKFVLAGLDSNQQPFG